MPTIRSGFNENLTVGVGEKIRLEVNGSCVVTLDGVTETLSGTKKDYGRYSSDKVLAINNVVGTVFWSRVENNRVEARSSGEAGVTFSSRSLTDADNGKVLLPSDASQTATINSDLLIGFGCAFNNNVTIAAGSGVTITDKRTTGATNPTCAIVNVGTNTYEVWGSKA